MSMYPRIRGRLIRPPSGLVAKAAGVAALRGRVSELTPLERVLAAVYHHEPDRVPVAPFIQGAARRLTGITYRDFALRPEKTAEAYMASLQVIGGDALYSAVDLSVEAADFGQAMVYPADSTVHPDYRNPRIKTVDDYERLEVFDPRKTPRMGAVIELGRRLSSMARLRYAVTGFVFGPLGVLGMMRGVQNLFKDCLRHPAKVKTGLEIVTEVLVAFVRAQLDAGVDGVMLDTLYASQSGMSRALWEEMEGPYARRIAEEIRSCNAMVTLHNCGHGPYFDLQIEYMQPVAITFAYMPDDCASPAELKRKYGGEVALIGYIPTDALYVEPPCSIMQMARKQIVELGHGGGFVLAPGCEYPPNIDFANARAMVRAAEVYGKYPLR